jgi:hypothetical protein
MMMNKIVLYVLLGLISIMLLFGSIFVVNEKERAIVFQFGEAVRPDISV